MPEEISRGQVRPSGRRPRKRGWLAPCPNGASKKMGRSGEWWRAFHGENAAKDFFDAPPGHGRFGRATGGHARCACLPPANLLRSPSGTKNKALATVFWSSARGQGRARILARRTSRSRLAAGDASDVSGCPRGFGAAAVGPRRTQPRSSGGALPRGVGLFRSAMIRAPPPERDRSPVAARAHARDRLGNIPASLRVGCRCGRGPSALLEKCPNSKRICRALRRAA